MKKLLSLILAITMVFTMTVVSAVSVSAKDTDDIAKTGINMPIISRLDNVYTGVKGTWNKVSGVYQYRFFVKTSASGSWTKVGDTTGTSLIYTGAKNNTKYYFTVRGMDKNGKYITSCDTAGTLTTFFSAPTLVSVSPYYINGDPDDDTNDEHGVLLKWKKVSGVRYYAVFKRKGSGAWTLGINDYTTADSMFVGDLTGGEKWSFTVRGVKDYFSTQYVTGFDPNGLSLMYYECPQYLDIENVYGGQKISWPAEKGVAKYRLFIQKSGKWTKLLDTDKISYLNKNVTSGVTYRYTIRSMDKNGNYISYCNTQGYKKQYVAAPEITDIHNYGDFIRVTFIAAKPRQTYRLYVKNGSSWKKVSDVKYGEYDPKNDYPYFFAEMRWPDQGKTYTFTVRALDKYGDPVSGFDPAGKSINATYYGNLQPRIETVRYTASGVYLKWIASENASKYRVFIDKGTGWTKLADTASASYTDKTAEKGKYVRYTIRAIGADGKFSSTYDTEGTYACYQTPAKNKVDDDKVKTTVTNYAKSLGLVTNIAINYNNLQHIIELPDDTLSYVNCGDMTDLIIYKAKLYLKAEVDYIKKCGESASQFAATVKRKRTGDTDYGFVIYMRNKDKPLNYEY